MVKQLKEHSAPELSADITTITAEIHAYKRLGSQVVFEIGRRLKHVKDMKLSTGRGGWTAWLREIDMSTSQADRFMKIAAELGDNFPNSGTISAAVLYEIATMPREARTRPHVIPSTGAVKMPADMTTPEAREVKKALKERDEAEERAKKAEEELEDWIDMSGALDGALRIAKEQAQEAAVRARQAEERALEAEAELARESIKDRPRGSNLSTVTVAIMDFNKGVRDLMKKSSLLLQYQGTIARTNDLARKEYEEAVDALHELTKQLIKTTEVGGIIDAEYTEL